MAEIGAALARSLRLLLMHMDVTNVDFLFFRFFTAEISGIFSCYLV